MNTSIETAETPTEGHFVPLGQSPPPPPDTTANDESAAIMADMAGGGDIPPDLASGKRRFKLSSQIVLMASVLILSAAALYFMRKLGTGAGMSFVQPPIDFVLDQEQPDRLAEHERMIQTLESLGIAPQMSEVDKNPFELIEPVVTEAADTGHRMEIDYSREVDRAAATLTLHSIIQGVRPVANVNSDLVVVGDTVAGILTVVEIGDRFIIVEAYDEARRIEMKERSSTPQRRRPR